MGVKTRSKLNLEDAPLRVRYNLSALPSSQHRAGLAGLVTHAQWMARQPKIKGIYAIEELSEVGATLVVDETGLTEAFDDLYRATTEEVGSDQPYKDKNGAVKPFIRKETRFHDEKEKQRSKEVYIYQRVVPQGSFLADEDASLLWVKMWRDFTWGIMRGVPAQRAPYEARARGKASSDASDAYKQLLANVSVDLASTYFLGAQACNAEQVSFADDGCSQFLLHFWTLVACLYEPRTYDVKKHQSEPNGIAVVVPDVAELETFVVAATAARQARSPKKHGYRPHAAIVDVAVEGALYAARDLENQLCARVSRGNERRSCLGFDVFHMAKEGNNVRVLEMTRVTPTRSLLDEHLRVIESAADPIFRTQRLANLFGAAPWFAGFDRLLASLDFREEGFGSKGFRLDCLAKFKELKKKMEDDSEVAGIENIIYRLVRTYVVRRAEERADRNGQSVEKAREKIAKDAFLAVRSRRGETFADYFASTIASVPQFLKREEFVRFSREIAANPDAARTLCLLALSAAAWSPTKKNEEGAS